MGPDLARTVGLMLIAYLAGSIPVGVIVARLVGGPDLRSIGSGRTGGTNAIRALGRKWAAVVLEAIVRRFHLECCCPKSVPWLQKHLS